MRDWKFRGYDATGQKGWVYGDLVHNQKVTTDGLEPRVMVGGYEVVSDSVGMFTGQKDSNGKEIYLGDILSIYNDGGKVFDAPVVWHKNMSAFMLHEDDGCYCHLPNVDMLSGIIVEVIGNVYERKDYKVGNV